MRKALAKKGEKGGASRGRKTLTNSLRGPGKISRERVEKKEAERDHRI